MSVRRENSIYCLTLTARRDHCICSPRKVGSPAETLPICGAGLGPSHLNLAGLTWNSLPVGLPQPLPLSQAGGLAVQLMSDTPPEKLAATDFQVFITEGETDRL